MQIYREKFSVLRKRGLRILEFWDLTGKCSASPHNATQSLTKPGKQEYLFRQLRQFNRQLLTMHEYVFIQKYALCEGYKNIQKYQGYRNSVYLVLLLAIAAHWQIIVQNIAAQM